MLIEHKTCGKDKLRQEDKRFGGCQGKNPKCGKTFDKNILIIIQ